VLEAELKAEINVIVNVLVDERPLGFIQGDLIGHICYREPVYITNQFGALCRSRRHGVSSKRWVIEEIIRQLVATLVCE